MEEKEKQTKVFDILDKMELFQGQRAGRELWNDKPKEVQGKELTNYFDNRVFKIKYITDYEQKDGYVVFVDESYYIGE